MKKTLIIIIGILYLGCNETSQTTSNSADVQTSQIGLGTLKK